MHCREGRTLEFHENRMRFAKELMEHFADFADFEGED